VAGQVGPGRVEQLVREEVAQVDREHVDDADARAGGDDGGQRLLVRVEAMGGEQDALVHAAPLPRRQQVVQQAVQRLLSERRAPHVPGTFGTGRRIDAVLHGRRAQDAERSGEVVGQPLHQEGAGAERQVGSRRPRRAHRDEDAGIGVKQRRHYGRREVLQPARWRGGERNGHRAERHRAGDRDGQRCGRQVAHR
jgi:hypothetical protein